MSGSLAQNWASHFGLAQSDLFAAPQESGEHSVLLDGGYGSFALSVTDEALWKSNEVRSWAWSSNLPHHLTITAHSVAVTRWDRNDAEEFGRSSVEDKLDTFYQYLLADRVTSSKRVVDHVLIIFRKLRSLVSSSGLPDLTTTQAFLALLARSVNETSEVRGLAPAILSEEGQDALNQIPSAALNNLLRELRSSSNLDSILLYPDLALRHAGSEIFQEAHFELIRGSSPDLFSDVSPAISRPITRSGSHFTPPALARALTEQTLAQISDLSTRTSLSVMDPACGSGAFLQEAVHALIRSGFQGQLTLIGRDISPIAIAMADFALSTLRSDWKGPNLVIDLQAGDALRDNLSVVDVVLMNPPFQSWSSLAPEQRLLVSEILGMTSVGRVDFSMAFVTRMAGLLKAGGAMGTLVPASLTTMQAADVWRNALLDQLDLRLIASLGDYSLFSNALVQVAALVFRRPEQGERRAEVAVGVTAANDPIATGEALRALRRGDLREADQWEAFPVDLKRLRHRAIWRLLSPKVERIISQIAETGGICQLGTLFDVRQGIRTGANKVFLLDQRQLRTLPPAEQKFFRPAVMNESISEAKILSTHWVFYPYGPEGLLISSEDDLKRRMPTYFARYLQPYKPLLEGRSNIKQSNIPWWALSVRRSWGLDTQQRIVSKYFGTKGGFSLDALAEFAVVQGFAWFPTETAENPADVDDDKFPSVEVLRCYVALFNSLEFEALLELFCPQVAGGQFDLSPRYVNEIPVPNFFELMPNDASGARLRQLASLGESARPSDPSWQKHTCSIVRDFYGTSIKGM